MKRSYWMIALSIIGLIIVGTVITLLVLSNPKAGAPSIDDEISQSGPLTLYFVAVDDNGQSGVGVGCGDSLISVLTDSVTTTDKVKSAFDMLLQDKNQYYGQSGLYNTLYKSNLAFVSSEIANNVVTVHLSGTVSLGGTCDNPRVKAQLESTAEAAAGVTESLIYINDKTLDEVLSLQ